MGLEGFLHLIGISWLFILHFSPSNTLLPVEGKGNNEWCCISRMGVCSAAWTGTSPPSTCTGLGCVFSESGRDLLLLCGLGWQEMDGSSAWRQNPPISCCPVSRRALRPQLCKLWGKACLRGSDELWLFYASDFLLPCLSWLTFVVPGPCLLALHLWGARSSAVFSCQRG